MQLSVHSLEDGPLTFWPGSPCAGCSNTRGPRSRTLNPHHTASRGAVARNRGRSGKVNLVHNGVLVIDQPTEFDRDTADALVAVAEDGQTVI